MNLQQRTGLELQSINSEIEMINLPKYGSGSCVVKDFETQKGCWNIQVDFSVENGGIDSLYFEDSNNNDDETFFVEEIDEIKSLYPVLFQNITSAIFQNIR